MADRFQYPVQAAIDPEALSVELRDEIQWWQQLSIPRLRRPSVAGIPSFSIDGDQLADDAAPEVVTLDEWQALSIPTIPIPRQQPDAFTTDQETLNAPLRDEIQWYSPFNLPVLPLHQTRLGWYTVDPEALSVELRSELEYYQPLSEPVLPRHLTGEGWFTIDTETLSAVLRDEIQWFSPFGVPVLPIPSVAGIPAFFSDGELLANDVVEAVTLDEYSPLSEPIRPILVKQPEAIVIDPATLDAALRDELEWWQDFGIPVLPRHLTRPDGQAVTDPETLNDPLDDKLEWFAEFDQPTPPRHLVRVGGQSPIDFELLGIPLRDKVEWFRLLSEPTLRRVSAENMPAFSMDPVTLGAEGVGTTFRRTFDFLGEKRGRDLLGKDTGVDLRGRKSGQDLTGEV